MTIFADMTKKRFSFTLLCFCALGLMLGCSGNGEQMRQQLEALEQQNVSGEPMLNDSLAESLVSYFDKHGDANERMRAKYILGRTYYCLGELPRALETYYEAADCADTTSSDCNFAKLSRIHAQSAVVFNSQVQPRSQLKELRLAEYYAKKGKDTLMAIECFAQQAEAYDFLHYYDSVITIRERASALFEEINRKDLASQTLGSAIPSLLENHNIEKAKVFIDLYENYSNLFDEHGDIEKGREIYYSIKGRYYLANHQLDSAEYMFRKELRDGKDLNNQIAAYTGLEKVFEQRKNSDSIAKYANLGYVLNDSAYSLSEMQNMQQLQASYNYNHHKYLSEKRKLEAQVAWLLFALALLALLLIGIVFGKKYHVLKKAAFDYRLKNANITRRLRTLANSNPPQYPDFNDWKKLRSLVEKDIPAFHEIMNKNATLTEMEYDICLMTRVQILPNEMARLKNCVPSYVSNIRKNLLKKVFGREGSADEFGDEIGNIGNF